MKNIGKLLALLLSILLTAAAVASCSTPGDPTEGTKAPTPAESGEVTSPAETTAPDPDYYVLPDVDLDGYEMNIFSIMGPVTTWLTFPYFTTEETGTKIGSTIYTRNARIEEQLHCKINEVNADSTNGELWVTLLADDSDVYQCGVDYSWNSIARGVENYLIDFNTLDSVHLDKPWWDSNLNDAYQINGRVFITSGSAMVSSWDEIFVMYFNADLAGDLGLNLYQEVKDGAWTFDRMCELIAVGDNSLNSVGAVEETYGLATQSFYSVPAFLGTNQVTYGILNENGKVENFSNSPKFVETAQILAEKLPASDSIYYGDHEINEIFTGGRAFFLNECIGAMANMRWVEAFDYGVLPMPLWEEGDDYHSYSGAQYLLFIPYTNREVEKTGTILEAMMGLSESTLKPVYIEDMLGQIYSRTPEAAEMLMDYILPNTLYDIGGRQGLQFNTLIPLDRAIPLGMTEIQSMVDSVVDTIQGKIDNINNYSD